MRIQFVNVLVACLCIVYAPRALQATTTAGTILSNELPGDNNDVTTRASQQNESEITDNNTNLKTTKVPDTSKTTTSADLHGNTTTTGPGNTRDVQ